MTDPQNIPYLIDLLDDDSQDIHPNVVRELLAFGPTLKPQLDQLGVSLNIRQQETLRRIYSEIYRRRLRQTWPLWFYIKDDYEKLEKALAILANFLDGYQTSFTLKGLLDDLADQYRARYSENHPRLLAEFLFQKKALRGNADDYYNPQNSNLIFVITKKKGIPISLASIFMLVGRRLGLTIEGCHFPGHFLARVRDGRGITFIDCFNEGRVIKKGDLLSVRPDYIGSLDGILQERIPAELVIRRYLANLICAYQATDDAEEGRLMIEFFKKFDQSLLKEDISPSAVELLEKGPKAFFKTGEVVEHMQYGYRGIIVDKDESCRATDDWYYSNQSQPGRNQPWYHVLVDGSDQVTYVAQSNLKPETFPSKIKHPLLAYFFIESKDGRYIRNDNPWPSKEN